MPKYRGLHAIAWAILNMEEELGNTIHLMNEYIDDGEILEQFKVKYESQTSQEIVKLFDDYVENNLGRVILEFIEGTIIPVKQDNKNATWVTKRNLTDCLTFLKLLHILTPRLDPSLTGLTTKGNFILFFLIKFFKKT